MRRVKQAEAFCDPFAKVLSVVLKRHIAANVDRPQVRRRDPIADPFGHHLAHAAGRLQADRIEPRCHKTALELGAFAKVVTHVRGEALRPAEEF